MRQKCRESTATRQSHASRMSLCRYGDWPGYCGIVDVNVSPIPMLKLFFLAALLSISGAAFGCTCPFIPLHAESVREAKKIFVFRLISAEVKRVDTEWNGGWEVVGRIKVIDRIRGRRAGFKEIRFSTHRCCGTRLDIGNYFVAFVSGNGPNFFAHSGNVHDVGTIYDQNETRGNILDIVSGKKEFEQVYSRESRDRIEQSPVPPPCFKAGEVQP